MSSRTQLFLFHIPLFYLLTLPILPALPNSDPTTIQQQPFLPTLPPPATIPAFPEQSNSAGCSLHLPDDLFPNVKSACSSTNKDHTSPLHYTRCCPTLAAWLYSAYSETALGMSRVAPTISSSSSPYDMPLLPDDSETCVDDLDKAMTRKGMKLISPNETCDLVYCYCGIRLHPLSCPESFRVNKNGKLVGDESVKKLEKDCSSHGLSGCSSCLKSLYLLYEGKTVNASELEDRTKKMRNKDCQLMGLTWLLSKNRTTYIHTVSAVLRAVMTSTDGSDPQSCKLNSDGMPLAVDYVEINNSGSSNFGFSIHLWLSSLLLMCMCNIVSLFP